MEDFKFVFSGGAGEITEKKSRFIASVESISCEQDALDFIAAKKKEYWDAKHNCYAYVFGSNNELSRCSDDGEPAQTAGRPILDVLLKEGIHDTVVVVTRYFGGVLLGTGGLVRAYQGATQAGLAASTVLTRHTGSLVSVKCAYTLLGKIQHILGKNEIAIKDTLYTDSVEFVIVVDTEKKEQLLSEIVEGTNGSAILNEMSNVTYAVNNGQLVIYPQVS